MHGAKWRSRAVGGAVGRMKRGAGRGLGCRQPGGGQHKTQTAVKWRRLALSGVCCDSDPGYGRRTACRRAQRCHHRHGLLALGAAYAGGRWRSRRGRFGGCVWHDRLGEPVAHRLQGGALRGALKQPSLRQAQCERSAPCRTPWAGRAARKASDQ